MNSVSSKNILIIVYDFPPEIGGGGVMRTVKFVKYLPFSGWRPIVLTVDRKDTWMPDAELLDEISSAEIHRCVDLISKYNFRGNDDNKVAGAPSGRCNYVSKMKNFLKDVLIPDKRVGWLIPAVRKGLKLIKTNNIDLIFATSPPQTPLLVGYFLSLLSGIKLVVDYRDAWCGNALFTSKYRTHNHINTWLEKIILRKADLVIATTKQIEDNLKIITTKSIINIPNGFDPEDFEDLSPVKLTQGKTNLVYLGGFSGYRTARYFVNALNILDSSIKMDLAIHIVGQNSSEEINQLLNVKGVDIILHGSLSHNNALRYLVSADALILFIFKEEGGDTAIPGKIYEYLAANKHIIAYAEKDSALAMLLYSLGYEHIVSPYDIRLIAKDLTEFVSKRNIKYKVDGCYMYSRKYNTEFLSEKLDNIINK